MVSVEGLYVIVWGLDSGIIRRPGSHGDFSYPDDAKVHNCSYQYECEQEEGILHDRAPIPVTSSSVVNDVEHSGHL